MIKHEIPAHEYPDLFKLLEFHGFEVKTPTTALFDGVLTLRLPEDKPLVKLIVLGSYMGRRLNGRIEKYELK